jgi:N-methylhydantoinase A
VSFGRGGTEPTVTDANLVLGRIGAGNFMKGKLKLDRDGALAAIREKVAQPLGYRGAAGVDAAAQGILDLAATTMASAIKEITIERGHDVREFSLFVFGGGGPLFGSILARSLRIPQVIIPPHPGNFSTLGMLIAGARIDLSRTVVGEAVEAMLPAIRAAFAELETSARATMKAELGIEQARYDRALEIRYRGQKHTVRVPYAEGQGIASLISDFEAIYRRRYGHANENNPIEILGVRLGAEAETPRPELAGLIGASAAGAPKPGEKRSVYFPAPHGRLDVPVWRRDTLPAGFELQGPAIIEEYSATAVLLPGDRARVGELGEIIVQVSL